MKTYEFVAKYGSGYDLRFGYGGRDEKGNFKKRAYIPFTNAIFITTDEELAEALLNHCQCGNNNLPGEKIFHLNQTDRKVTDRYGKDDELAQILLKKNLNDLRRMASKFKGNLTENRNFLSYKKQELIGKLLQNPEKTRQMI
jgi:hypothetical protein